MVCVGGGGWGLALGGGRMGQGRQRFCLPDLVSGRRRCVMGAGGDH